jgi:hypothetical protein
MLRVKTLRKIRGEDVVGRYEIDYMMIDLSWQALLYCCVEMVILMFSWY